MSSSFLLFLTMHYFLNYSPSTLLYPLSLHDALPISGIAINLLVAWLLIFSGGAHLVFAWHTRSSGGLVWELLLGRSEEHTSELQSNSDLVFRFLLEKKKKNDTN